MGATPHKAAKADSDFRRSGLLPAVIRSVAAVLGPTPKVLTNAGAVSKVRRCSSLSISRISEVSCWYRRARDRRVCFATAAEVSRTPVRKALHLATSLEEERPRNFWRSSKGAVTTKAFIWFMACVRALIAESLVLLSIRSISTLSLPVLGLPLAIPARTARAATSASMGSLFPNLRRVDLSGRPTSMTV
jgi:hypothetical protein